MTAGHGDHSDLWNYIEGLREDLGRAEKRIRELEDRVRELEECDELATDQLGALSGRVEALEVTS
jgi:transcription elongation GreA/GreB family factor